MQVYSNTPVEEFEKARVELNEALDKETKTIVKYERIYLLQASILIAAVLVSLQSDHFLVSSLLPATILLISIVVGGAVDRIKWMSWDNYLKKKKAFLEKSTALSEYNTQKVLEIMGEAELLTMSGSDGFIEQRTIN